MNALPPPLLAETLRSGIQWHHMPPAWVLVLVVAPLVVLLSWWAYRREADVPPRARFLLASLRALAIAFFVLVLLGPFAEVYETRIVRSHLVVLLDVSQSMDTKDEYEPDDARALAKATGLPPDRVSASSRLDLARRVLANRDPDLLGRWTKDFRLHVFAFGSQATPLVSTGDADLPDDGAAEEAPDERVRRRLAEISATDPATRLGQAVAVVCDTFRQRDEQVAGVVVVSDGQDNGTVVTPLQAGRRAAAMHVPVFSVGVGDPRSPRNIHVGNLRAKEVVLARDTAVFEFGVHARGFEGRRARVEMYAVAADGRTRPLPVIPSEVMLEGGDREQNVRVTHQFSEAGLVTLRIGIPVQPEEKIRSDNFVEHTIRVIDRKIKVLYLEGYSRNEFTYLSQALTRDRDTMLAHTLLFDADPEFSHRRTNAPDWPALDASLGLPPREKLFEYDVLVLGDVDWRKLAPAEEKAREALANIRDFVDKGGGLILVAGPWSNPTRYKDTEIQGLLPVVLDRSAERANPEIDTTVGFALRLTPDGMESPLMNVAGDAEASRALWEKAPRFRQYWSYPALRAKTLAKVLAVSDHPRHQDERHGPRPLIATMLYGRGRVLYVGVDDLWRMRWETADRYFYRFYGEAVRFLATYKLLGGNKRFKILTDRDRYSVDDPVRITLDVLDRDYEPAKAPHQTVRIEMPGAPAGSLPGGQPGARETLELQIPADPTEPGTYRRTILPNRPGEYRVQATTDDPADEAPEKVFRVVASTAESRDLLLDEARLREMADASEGGRYVHLADLPTLRPESREKPVPTDKREDELWDSWWTLAAGVALLSLEWLLRKRWHLV